MPEKTDMKHDVTKALFEPPKLEGLIDNDVLDRFKNTPVFYGDIINAQLIKTNKELLDAIRQIKI